ncbi:MULTISPECIES: thioredoxin family protein [Rhizobium/Agrobacterium group]|nr:MULTISPECIES: thioredoxin family protein [Rhizobium/Agrobacterium group]
MKDTAVKFGVNVKVEKAIDHAEIAKFGIASEPGIVTDGKIVHTDRRRKTPSRRG